MNMSKFIKLPDGDWVRISDILKIGTPYFNSMLGSECWECSIAYINPLYPESVSFHVYKMNKKFVTNEEKATEKVKSFVDSLNNHL